MRQKFKIKACMNLGSGDDKAQRMTITSSLGHGDDVWCDAMLLEAPEMCAQTTISNLSSQTKTK